MTKTDPVQPAPRVSAPLTSPTPGEWQAACDVLEAKLRDARAAITALEAENARLREDMATAKRDAWIACQKEATLAVGKCGSYSAAVQAIAALTPPVEAQGGSDD